MIQTYIKLYQKYAKNSLTMAAILNLGVTAILDFKMDNKNKFPISKLVKTNSFVVNIACLHDFQLFTRSEKRPFWKTLFSQVTHRGFFPMLLYPIRNHCAKNQLVGFDFVPLVLKWSDNCLSRLFRKFVILLCDPSWENLNYKINVQSNVVFDIISVIYTNLWYNGFLFC